MAMLMLYLYESGEKYESEWNANHSIHYAGCLPCCRDGVDMTVAWTEEKIRKI